MKKMISLAMAGILALSLAACGGSNETKTTDAPASDAQAAGAADTAADNNTTDGDGAAAAEGLINVISREDGSGTRGAFIELMGVEVKNEDGEKEDMTTEDAQIISSTSGVMTTVAGDSAAIGYISLASLDDSVKALKVNGVEATPENVMSGDYAVSRPFNIVTKSDISEVAQDFVDFIMSDEGQAVVAEAGNVPVETTGAYAGSQPSGKVVVGGSSSVTPVMEKLSEAYKAVNPNAEVEVQQTDSTTGVTSTNEGLYDIGMASRELKDSEKELGLTATVIAKDGIAIIVNTENPISDMTNDQIRDIYTGVITDWSEIK